MQKREKKCCMCGNITNNNDIKNNCDVIDYIFDKHDDTEFLKKVEKKYEELGLFKLTYHDMKEIINDEDNTVDGLNHNFCNNCANFSLKSNEIDEKEENDDDYIMKFLQCLRSFHKLKCIECQGFK